MTTQFIVILVVGRLFSWIGVAFIYASPSNPLLFLGGIAMLALLTTRLSQRDLRRGGQPGHPLGQPDRAVS